MVKTYNTPKRNHIVKTRLDDEEYADFLRRLEIYNMNQSEFIREAISGATIKPTIVATLVSDDLLAAIGEISFGLFVWQLGSISLLVGSERKWKPKYNFQLLYLRQR